jgi:TatD DNase family protein
MVKMPMFDSHAHVASLQFDLDRPVVIERARAAGVDGWLEVASTAAGSRRAVELAEQLEGTLATVGVHPEEIDVMQEEDWQLLDELAGSEKVVAIGEVGLDFHREGTYEKQIEYVKKFVDLAVKHHKPIVWHVRSSRELDANELLLEYLTNLITKDLPRGIAHTFSGTVEQANRYIGLGQLLGISGIVTFKNAGVLLDVVREVALENLLIETDSPFLTPDPYRGQRNEPAYVKLVAQKIAQLKEVTIEEVEKVTYCNWQKLIVSQKV